MQVNPTNKFISESFLTLNNVSFMGIKNYSFPPPSAWEQQINTRKNIAIGLVAFKRAGSRVRNNIIIIGIIGEQILQF